MQKKLFILGIGFFGLTFLEGEASFSSNNLPPAASTPEKSDTFKIMPPEKMPSAQNPEEEVEPEEEEGERASSSPPLGEEPVSSEDFEEEVPPLNPIGRTAQGIQRGVGIVENVPPSLLRDKRAEDLPAEEKDLEESRPSTLKSSSPSLDEKETQAEQKVFLNQKEAPKPFDWKSIDLHALVRAGKPKGNS